MTNRIWIEIERPSNSDADQKAIATDRAAKFSAVLRKLNVDPKPGHDCIWWNDRTHRYCITVDGAGGFLEMNDSGHWFNLDQLAI